MKRVLLSSLFLLMLIPAVLAYETVIIKYPPGELWVKAYYKKIGNESILQYVPSDQSYQNWNRTIIIHAYYELAYPLNIFISNEIMRMKKNNPTGNYKYLKLTDKDSMVYRCTNDYKNIKAQCEFYRTTNAHNGIVSIHYINRNKENFMDNYHEWYSIIKKAKFYNSYYRNERTLNKSEYFELWDD